MRERNKSTPVELRHRVKYPDQEFSSDQPIDLASKAYLSRSVTHGWHNEDCSRIMQTLAPAVEKHGTKLFIIDRAQSAKLGDISMLAKARVRDSDLNMLSLSGAKERTRLEWQRHIHICAPKVELESL